MAAIAAATIGSFIGFGLPLLRNEVAKSMQDDVAYISKEMGYIRACFRDHSRYSAEPDEVTQVWLDDMKLLAYDIEDFTDRFLSRFMPQDSEAPGSFLRRAWRFFAIRQHIGGRIEDLKRRSMEVSDWFEKYKVKKDAATDAILPSTEVPPHLSMEEAAKSLRQLLLCKPRESEKKLKVISIVSYGALGNTLLVDKVYHNTNVGDKFPVRYRVDAAGKTLDQVLIEIKKLPKKHNGGSTSHTVDQKGKCIMEEHKTMSTTHTVDHKDNGIMEEHKSQSCPHIVVHTGNGIVEEHNIQSSSNIVDHKGNGVVEEYNTQSSSHIVVHKANGFMEEHKTHSPSHTVDPKGNGTMDEHKTPSPVYIVDPEVNGVMDDEHKTQSPFYIVDPESNGVRDEHKTQSPSHIVVHKGKGIMEEHKTQSPFHIVDHKVNDVMEENKTKSSPRTVHHMENCVMQMEQQEIVEDGATISNVFSPAVPLPAYQTDTRYLIVIDNVKMVMLERIIKHYGDEEDDIIIATTDYTEAIHCMCSSLALGGSTTSQYLIKELVIKDLTNTIDEDETRMLETDLQNVLVSKYKKSLSSNDLEECLLYLCMFPHDHLVRWNLLKMRYLAEGIVLQRYARSPRDSLKDFVDQHEVQPIQVRKNGQVKRCQLPVMLLNHISGESKSKNFLTLSCGSTNVQCLNGDVKESVRRLSLHPVGARNCPLILPNASDLCRLRTLVIFHTGSIANKSELFKFKLLRVLDLKECVGYGGIGNEHVEKICDLLLLKYLSLGDTIDEVPRDIAKLQLLETLAMTKTKTVNVPVEVMELPQLKHLLGKFQLYIDDIKDNKRKQLSKKESKLERLSGFFVGDSKECGALMSRMTRLRKVKIWYDAEKWTDDVSAAIKNFIGKSHPLSLDNKRKGSLSIACKVYPQEFMDSLKDPGTLLSLKLCGDLRTFLGFQPEAPIRDHCNLTGIEELCLSGTNLKGDEIVRVVQLFGALTYLKLVEDDLGPLEIPAGCLTSLERLCLVAVDTLRDITIQDGALVCLVSLHMLFGKQENISRTDIRRLKYLKEIALHSGVDQDIKKVWEEKSSKHRKKPKVVLIQSPEIEKKASNSSDEQSPASRAKRRNP